MEPWTLLFARLGRRARLSYGWAFRAVHRAALLGLLMGAPHVAAAAMPLRVVALGDSLTAGYMLPADAAFPVVLQKALRAAGVDATIGNAGVSGDTARAGLDRLDWSVPDGTDAVILELGANDMLQGKDPGATRATLAQIIERLQARHIKVLLAGMRASPSLGRDYVTAFDAIYPGLARQYGVPLYPFFLDSIIQVDGMHLPDGLHPNRPGVERIVAAILPSVEQFLAGVRKG